MKNILFLLILLIISCNNENKSIDKQINHFSIYDSIKVNYPVLRYSGITQNNLLFSDRIGQNIILFDYIKGKTKIINKHGGGPKEYNRVITRNVNFLNDSTIVVSDIKVYKKYDLNGNYKNTIQLNNQNTFAPTQFVKQINDSLVVLFKGIQGNPSTPEYYKNKQKLFIVKNILNGNEIKIIDYPLPNSDIVMDDSYLSYIYDFDIRYIGNIAYLINSNDEAFYKINLLDNKVERINLDLEFYKPVKYKFGQVGDFNNQIIDLYTGSIINQLNISKNYIFIQYTKPFKRGFILNYKKENNNYPKKETYLQILKDNKKVFEHDILLPNDFGGIVYIKSKDSLLIRKPSTESDEYNNISTFYWVKLEKLPAK